MNHSITRSPELAQHLNEQGYAVLDLLNESEVAKIMAFKNENDMHISFHNGIHISFEHSDLNRTTLNNKIECLLEDGVNQHFVSHKILQCSFLLKEPLSNTNSIDIHQDWSFVNEHEGFKSYTVWTALHDIDNNNGGLYVIPKSHRITNYPRKVPVSLHTTPLKLFEKELKGWALPIFLKKGQAIIYDHRTLHGSFPNTSQKERVVVGFSITHIDSELQLYYTNPVDNKDKLYSYAKSFFLEKNNSYSFEQAYEDAKIPSGLVFKRDITKPEQDYNEEEIKESIHLIYGSHNPQTQNPTTRFFLKIWRYLVNPS